MVLCSFLKCIGQVNDSFSDNNITDNPIWFGNLNDFKIEEGKLLSAKAEINTKFYLSTENEFIRNTQWTFNIDLLFNPSGANYVDVFLTASDTNLLTSQNGYFVRLGGTKDEICLYKKVNGATTLLIDGEDGMLNKSNNHVSLKVICDKNFKWELRQNISAGSSLGTVQDSSISTSKWFGFAITQSTTGFFSKHYFDNVVIEPINTDTTAPVLLSADFQDGSTLVLHFDEPVDTFWAKRKDMFELHDRLGARISIESAALANLSGDLLKLHLSEQMAETSTLLLSVAEVQDRSGNAAGQKITNPVYFFKPVAVKYKDLILTELMIDPAPSEGLPEKEFIEIYNRSGNNVDLNGFTLSDPTISSKLPPYILPQSSYLILCKNTDTTDFKIYGKVLGLATIPGLNNSEDDLRLYDKEMKLIDRVNYSQSWYRNTSQDDGGYSLELIDPENTCLGKNNWQASVNLTGGTPGLVNSVNQSLKDSVPPKIKELTLREANWIDVVFDEIMDSSAFKHSNFLLTPRLQISNVYWKRDSLDKVSLEFATSVIKNKDYELMLNKAKDCAGNETIVSGEFILTDIALKGEVLINELLFNPYPYGSDFVEIYNNSEKSIDLKGWKFGNVKNDTVANKVVIFASSFVLKPYEFLAIADNKQNVLDNYPKSKAGRLVEIKSLPTFYDDEGSAVLLNNRDEIIDRFDYNESLHSPFISNKQGVSLEKINPALSSTDPGSWTSASKEVGSATPGYVNSQTLGLSTIEDLVEITPSLITPNQDGDNDFMVIRLKTDKAGSLRNLHIYDLSGRIIKHLERNNYASTATLVQWDGSDDSNALVPIGHYMLWMEIIDKDGNVNHLRKKVVVGERF